MNSCTKVEVRLPEFANYVNYLTGGVLLSDLNSQQQKRFLHEVKGYLWNDLLLFKICSDNMIRRCLPVEEHVVFFSTVTLPCMWPLWPYSNNN